jgi:hypothetical protein
MTLVTVLSLSVTLSTTTRTSSRSTICGAGNPTVKEGLAVVTINQMRALLDSRATAPLDDAYGTRVVLIVAPARCGTTISATAQVLSYLCF